MNWRSWSDQMRPDLNLLAYKQNNMCGKQSKKKKLKSVARLKSWMQTVFIHSTELDIFCIEDGLKCQFLYKASKSMKTFFSFQRHCWNYTIQNKLTLLGEKSQMCVFTFLLQ